MWGKDGAFEGAFFYCRDVATDFAGNVYVTDEINNRVQKFDSRGNFLAKWGKRGGRVLYLLADPAPEKLRACMEKARGEANCSADVWIIARAGAEPLPRHLNIRVTRAGRFGFPWAALNRALFKKKKVERIEADAAWLRALLGLLRPLHGARVETL